MTIVIITHRLTTVINADKKLVLDGGKIVEEGEPDKLLKDPDSYFHKVHNVNL